MPVVAAPGAWEAEQLLQPSSDGQRRLGGDSRWRWAATKRLALTGLLLACAGAVVAWPRLLAGGRGGTALRAPGRPLAAPERLEGGVELQLAPPTRSQDPFHMFEGILNTAPLPGLSTLPPLPYSPFGADSSVGGGKKWKAFASSEEAFAFLDKDGDGVLTYAGDHINRLKNVTVGVPKGVFEMYFNSEKLRLVSRQNVRAPMAMGAVSRYQALAAMTKTQEVKEPREMKLAIGVQALEQRLVRELYTFGAPGTAPLYVYDATRPGGCFKGLRTFSRGERYTVAFGAYFTISDPVAWITSVLNYDHAKMEALEAQEDNVKDNVIHPCDSDYQEVVMSPKQDSFFWFGGHMIYEDVLKAHADFLDFMAGNTAATPQQARELQAQRTKADKVKRAHQMSHWAFINYQTDSQLIALDAKDHGFTLVARSCSGKDGIWAPRCNDHIALFQNDRTLECVLAFEGSDDVLDWVSDLDAFVEDFCGFGHVHRGFKFKLMTMMQSIDYRQTVLPKLPSCATVDVVGHSLGGAQAELFTACVNRGLKEGEPGYEDFRHLVWPKGTPARLPGFFDNQVEGGVFLRNRGNGLCMDVRGTMETKYEEDVIVYPCEMPGSNYSKDQHWTLTPEGRIVNELTGYCVSASVLDEDGEAHTALRQWPCGQAGSDDQLFHITKEGFLQSKKTGACVDSKLEMSQCPYTDQRWELTPDGHIQNVLSGMCLDVAGNPGTEDGSGLLTWQCEHTPTTDQLWSLTPEGVIKNSLSGKCVSFRNEQGRENQPYLVIASCQPGEVSPDMQWELGPNGFVRNKRTGMCMDVQGSPGVSNGTKVTLYKCEDKHLQASGLWVQMEGGFLRNVGTDCAAQHRCLEVFGAYGTGEKYEAGGKLHLTGCEVNTDQRWQITPQGYIKSVLGSRKCLEVKPGNVNGALWLQNCKSPDDPNLYLDFKWQLTPEGLIKSAGSLECFGVDAQPNQAAGARITVSQCNATQALTAQKWEIRSDGFILHRLTGLCLDVRGNPGVLDYSPLVLWHCEQGPNFDPAATDQRWQLLASGLLRNSLSAKCLRQDRGQPSLVSCPDEQQSQQWRVLPTGLVMNQQTGRCIDVERNETAGSAPSWSLVSWTCDPARPEQQWEHVLA